MESGFAATAAAGIGRLPEGCISHVLSLTTPKDTCRSALAGAAFRSASESDAVWEGFLPSDYKDVLARADEPVEFASKKELYFRLCRPLLIDNGKKSFVLEKSTGNKCYMLSARDLRIVWGDTPTYWSWESMPDSRFSEVAKLRNVCWLEIGGKLRASMLSPTTTYVAYLVYKLRPDSYGLITPPPKATVTIGPHTSTSEVRLLPKDHKQPTRTAVRGVGRRSAPWRYVLSTRIRLVLHDALPNSPEEAAAVEEGGGGGQAREGRSNGTEQVSVARDRSDGWLEVAMGEFVVDQGYDGEVEMVLMETEGGHWKRGLMIQGIEVRPKN